MLRLVLCDSDPIGVLPHILARTEVEVGNGKFIHHRVSVGRDHDYELGRSMWASRRRGCAEYEIRCAGIEILCCFLVYVQDKMTSTLYAADDFSAQARWRVFMLLMFILID